uniref:hypothetical protein n=1 Tax=Pararhizobium sp. IMCC3301 TaxID=3067904 RepID=UPI00274211B3|nr:hypothetical protein [Pararhizobium sp. IMCC3301]
MPPETGGPVQPIRIELSRNVAIPLTLILLAMSGWLALTLIGLPVRDEFGVAVSVQDLIAGYVLGGSLALAMAAPAYTMIRAMMMNRPFACFDETGVRALNWPLMRNSITWQDVDKLTGKGIWVVMLDRKNRRHKMIESMVGAKGLWLPTILAKGGTAPIAEAIRTYRPDLFSVEKLS